VQILETLAELKKKEFSESLKLPLGRNISILSQSWDINKDVLKNK